MKPLGSARLVSLLAYVLYSVILILFGFFFFTLVRSLSRPCDMRWPMCEGYGTDDLAQLLDNVDVETIIGLNNLGPRLD